MARRHRAEVCDGILRTRGIDYWNDSQGIREKSRGNCNNDAGPTRFCDEPVDVVLQILRIYTVDEMHRTCHKRVNRQ